MIYPTTLFGRGLLLVCLVVLTSIPLTVISSADVITPKKSPPRVSIKSNQEDSGQHKIVHDSSRQLVEIEPNIKRFDFGEGKTSEGVTKETSSSKPEDNKHIYTKQTPASVKVSIDNSNSIKISKKQTYKGTGADKGKALKEGKISKAKSKKNMVVSDNSIKLKELREKRAKRRDLTKKMLENQKSKKEFK